MNTPAWTHPLVMPRRRALRRLDWLPALVFLVTLGATLAVLITRDVLLLARPLGLLALLAAPWIVWTQAQGYGGLTGGRGVAAQLCRLSLLAALAVALAEPRAVRVHDGLSVVYALDVSDSVGSAAADASMKFVLETASKKPPKDRAGLLVFGRTAAVELPPRESFPFEAMNTRVAKDATDLARALSTAGALLPEEMQGRVVLISDGADNEGDLTRSVENLQARGIHVEVLPISYGFPEEVWLERLALPHNVKIGETYEAEVVLQSLRAGRGTLSLVENGKEIGKLEVDYQAGPNRFRLPVYLREAGFYEYTARIEVPEGRDGWKENNLALGDLFLRGEGRVLLITDKEGDARDWQKMASALREGKRLVDVKYAYELPRDAVSLLQYDAAVMVNVPAEQLDAVQMTALKDASFKLGLGVLMIGGKNSFGAGGWNRTPVEDLLPVSMDILQKKVLPKAALAIVLHTCEFPEGNEWGKRVAKEAIRVLNKQDEAGVLVYSWGQGTSGEQWLFPMTPVTEYEKMVTLISGAQIGDMPSFASTMDLALAGLKKSDAAMKHMIIISDGDPSPPPPQTLQGFAKEQISITTVSIFPHGGSEVEIMKVIASATGGRYYNVTDPAHLPGIFLKEAKTLKKNLLQNEDFVPESGFPSPILKGVDAMPQLHGYVLTTAKPGSLPVLTHRPADSEERDPILSVWQFGLGKNAAFTSDLSPNWGKDWIAWEQYRAFVNQLVGDVARASKDSQVTLQAQAEGGRGVVTLEDRHPQGGRLQVEGEVTRPDHGTEPLRFVQTAPRVYQAEFPLSGQGRYQVMVAGAAPGRSEQAAVGFAVPFSREYLRFRSDPARLRGIAESTGGRVLSGRETSEDLYQYKRERKKSSRPITEWLLGALAVLLPLDVAIRRVQIDWAALRRRRAEAGEKARETTGNLLKKKTVREPPPARSVPSIPVPPRPISPTRPASSEAKPPPPPAPDVGKPEPQGGTSSRLLDMKRRKGQKPSDDGGTA